MPDTSSHPGTPPAFQAGSMDAPHAATPLVLMAFEAQTPHGSFHLTLPACDSHGDAVSAALALAAAEPLLAELERRLDVAIDPTPCEAAEHSPGDLCASICAKICNAELAPAGTRIRMPVELIRQGRGWPSALGGLVWNALSFELELARFAKTPLPRNAWNAGGILLLPGSFDSPWKVRLIERQLGIEMPAVWTGPGSPVQIAGAACAFVEDHRNDWRVMLATPLCVDVQQCFGIAHGSGGPSSNLAIDNVEACAVLIAPRRETALARGMLIPALQGTGLWLVAPDGSAATQATTTPISEAQPA